MTNQIVRGDNLSFLRAELDAAYDLIYIDPPFNTGRVQRRARLSTVRDAGGDRTGFSGQKYKTITRGLSSFEDRFDDYLSFMEPRLVEAHRLLADDGSLFLHADYREVHYLKVMLDGIFGRDALQNEIIWAYDFGGRGKRRWPAKHDTILWYAKDPKRYHFDFEAMDRIPYMAPGLVGPKKAARGKTPTDVWWHTIVPTAGKERTGYATQKPLGVLERIIKVHAPPGGRCLDFFAGSGTLGEAAAKHGHTFTLVDISEQAVQVMARRLADFSPSLVNFEASSPMPMAPERPSTRIDVSKPIVPSTRVDGAGDVPLVPSAPRSAQTTTSTPREQTKP